MICEVTYYQVVCDVCGAVDDRGAHSAWAEPEQAHMAAAHAGWNALRGKGLRILVCNDHHGEGFFWCSTCTRDLEEESGWEYVGPSLVLQHCPAGHENLIELKDFRTTVQT